MYGLALQDPFPIIKYAKDNHLMNQKPFKFLINFCAGDAPSRLAKAFKTSKGPRGHKYKFGVQVPCSMRQAMMLDTEAGNTLWLEAIQKELKQINEYNTFRML